MAALTDCVVCGDAVAGKPGRIRLLSEGLTC